MEGESGRDTGRKACEKTSGGRRGKASDGARQFLRKHKVGENAELNFLAYFLVDCKFVMLGDMESSFI